MKRKTVTFTRREVIKALRTENLAPEAWFSFDGQDERDPFEDMEAIRDQYGYVELDITKSKVFKNCNVCAVGSLVRSKASELSGFINSLSGWDSFMNSIFHATKGIATIEDKVDSCDGELCGDEFYGCEGDCYEEMKERAIADLIKKKNYLGALSAFFEDMMEGRGEYEVTKKHRDELIKFVKKNFPVSFKATFYNESV